MTDASDASLTVRSSLPATGRGTAVPASTHSGAAQRSSNRSEPVVSLRAAELTLGDRVLWSGLDLDLDPGEFVAVLGSNGSGKTSLLRAVLGEYQLSSGTGEFLGRSFHRGDPRIGYVPKHHLSDVGVMMRGRDLVTLGLTGHRWGPGWPSRRRRARIDALLADVGALSYADAPVGLLSGGEQQRLRIAQALVADPQLLLCDEPLASLDLRAQAEVVGLIDGQRRRRGFGVLFVTHDVNPVLEVVDRVLYLGNGRFRIGTPDEVMRSDVLSELYDAPVEVIRASGRIIVVGTPEQPHHPQRKGA